MASAEEEGEGAPISGPPAILVAYEALKAEEEGAPIDTRKTREMLLRQLPALLSREAAERLADRSSLLVLETTTRLLKQGQIPDYVFIVVAGDARLVAEFWGKDHASSTDSWLRKPQKHYFKPRIPANRYDVEISRVGPGEILGCTASLFTPPEEANVYRGGILISDQEKEFRPATMNLPYSVIGALHCVVLRIPCSEFRQALLLRPSLVDMLRKEEFMKYQHRVDHVERIRDAQIEHAETEKWNMCLYSADMESRARYRPRGFRGRLYTEWEIDGVLQENVLDMGDPCLYDDEDNMNPAEAQLTRFNKQVNLPREEKEREAKSSQWNGKIIDRTEAERVILEALSKRNSMFGGAVLTPELRQRAAVKMAFDTEDYQTSAEARQHIVTYGEIADKALKRAKMRAHRTGLTAAIADAPALTLSPSFSRTSRIISKTHIALNASNHAELGSNAEEEALVDNDEHGKVSEVLQMLHHDRGVSEDASSLPSLSGDDDDENAEERDHTKQKTAPVRPSTSSRHSRTSSVSAAVDNVDRKKLLPAVDAEELSRKLRSLMAEPEAECHSSFGVDHTDEDQEVIVRSGINMDAVNDVVAKDKHKASNKRRAKAHERLSSAQKSGGVAGSAIRRHGLNELQALNEWWSEHSDVLQNTLRVAELQDVRTKLPQNSVRTPGNRSKRPRGATPPSTLQPHTGGYVGLIRRSAEIVPLALDRAREKNEVGQKGSQTIPSVQASARVPNASVVDEGASIESSALLRARSADVEEGAESNGSEAEVMLVARDTEITIVPFPTRQFLSGETDQPNLVLSARRSAEPARSQTLTPAVHSVSPFYDEHVPSTRLSSEPTARIGEFQKEFINQSESIQRALRRRMRPQSAVMKKFVSRTMNATDVRQPRPVSAFPRSRLQTPARISQSVTMHRPASRGGERKPPRALAPATRLSKQKHDAAFRMKGARGSSALRRPASNLSVQGTIDAFNASPRKQLHESFRNLQFARRGQTHHKTRQRETKQQTFGAGFRYTKELARWMAQS